MSTRRIRSKACCDPVVTITSSGFALMRRRAIQATSASRSGASPCVFAYCSQRSGGARIACSIAACNPSASNTAGDG
jgi:hypothetical protein